MFIFRRIAPSDLEKLRIWRMLPDVTKYLFTDPVITPEGQKKWYEGIKDGDKLKCWIIDYNSVDIGFTNIVDIDEYNKRGDPGMFICDKEYRGKGLAKHILANVQRHAFEDLGLHRLIAPIITANAPVVILHMRNGFEIDGYFKDHIYKNGRFWDVAWMGMCIDRWHYVKDGLDYTKGIFEGY